MNTQAFCHVVAQSIPLLLDFPTRRFSVDYDRDADVLYISFDRPQNATDSEMTDDGFLLRYRGEQLVGVTILDASLRAARDAPERP
uniref:Uncharacterized protein YuzE n=1 Tax=Candidatus Kentrum sp. DK TaxID=2126562 RepID=A0A450TI18_9GAMM|nr:MAG: Uncharacterized protein YuzE [Candidatus Kentron sp. DK]VFJ66810.1 MAG: Uncharacterized protein YuzE [Candidatus Kentron sp. DK]